MNCNKKKNGESAPANNQFAAEFRVLLQKLKEMVINYKMEKCRSLSVFSFFYFFVLLKELKILRFLIEL